MKNDWSKVNVNLNKECAVFTIGLTQSNSSVIGWYNRPVNIDDKILTLEAVINFNYYRDQIIGVYIARNERQLKEVNIWMDKEFNTVKK